MRRRSQSSKGQSLVESALILTAFMGLLLGMAGVGESLFVRQTLGDRARIAARWGALNPYDPGAIRRIVLFGTAEPAPGQSAFFGLSASAVEVSNPGCPGPSCRISIEIPRQGIRSVEPMDSSTPSLAQASTPGPVASIP
jgi:hypothetical protein